MQGKNAEAGWLIRQVAEGDSALDASAVSHMAQQLGICFPTKGSFCVVVKYQEQDQAYLDATLGPKLLCACQDVCKRYPLNAFCYIGNHLYVVMVVMDAAVHRTAVLEAVMEEISRSSPAPVQMGVGRCYEQIEKLNYSRVEAYEVLNSGAKTDAILYIDDVYATRDMTTMKLGREKRKIVELFKAGSMEQLKRDMEELVEHVRAESPVRKDQPYPTSIRRTVVELLFEIMHICADTGVDVDCVLDYQDPYNKIFAMNDTPDILAWFYLAVQSLLQALVEQRNRTEKNMLVLAKKCIDEHLQDPDLSLTLISNSLGITPTYFSAFFIRELGIGFNEYITCQRIEKAKQLLGETNMKINEIAVQSGFRSASYFTVVFRKQMAMSPGEYRNMKNQNK